MTTPDRLKTLISALINGTRSGKVDWTRASRDDSFAFSGSAASVILSSVDGDAQPPYLLALFDANGSLVEQVTSGNYDEPYGKLHDLYPLARSNAVNIDSVVDSLLGEIEVEGPAETTTPSGPTISRSDYDDLPF